MATGARRGPSSAGRTRERRENGRRRRGRFPFRAPRRPLTPHPPRGKARPPIGSAGPRAPPHWPSRPPAAPPQPIAGAACRSAAAVSAESAAGAAISRRRRGRAGVSAPPLLGAAPGPPPGAASPAEASRPVRRVSPPQRCSPLRLRAAATPPGGSRSSMGLGCAPAASRAAGGRGWGAAVRCPASAWLRWRSCRNFSLAVESISPFTLLKPRPCCSCVCGC